MKKNKIYIILFLLLLSLAAYFYFNGRKSTLNLREKDFSIEDTGAIYNITIAGQTDTLRLFKSQKSWKVNNIFNVNKRSLHYFLSMQKRISVVSPAAKEKEDIIAEQMDTGAVHVQIKCKRRRNKHYLVYKAHETGETYMRTGSSGRIFKVYIPSHQGDVAGLFITDVHFWRDNTLFNFPVKNIRHINVSYPGEQDKSFSISVDNNGDIFFNNEKAGDTLKRKIINYFYDYENVKVKNYLDEMPAKHIPEKEKKYPACVISVKNKDNINKTVSLYNKKAGKEDGGQGTTIKYDPHVMYGCIQKPDEWFLIRYIDIAPLLKKKKYFISP